jgi:hypothetical protein
MKKAVHPLLALLFCALLVCAAPARAQCVDTPCTDMLHSQTRDDFITQGQRQAVGPHITNEFIRDQDWMIRDFFVDYIFPVLLRITHQLSRAGMVQIGMIGTFFDAQNYLDTQLAMQTLEAEAHDTYHSSVGMCVFGTVARGLGEADANMQASTVILQRRSIDRQLGEQNTTSAGGLEYERRDRVAQLKQYFCDAQDSGFAVMCATGARPNRDIDYASTIGNPRTLKLDLPGAVDTADEEDFLALSNNLFGHYITKRLAEAIIGVKSNENHYLDVRSIVAKRSVAENSFYAISAMKSQGSTNTQDIAYVGMVAQAMGVQPREILTYLGDRPSYYALMDMLAQKIYQDPEFYANLYDTPANVARKDVAMQAINLMLGRDMFRSELRSEAMLSVLLEMELRKYHEAVQNRSEWMVKHKGNQN